MTWDNNYRINYISKHQAPWARNWMNRGKLTAFCGLKTKNYSQYRLKKGQSHRPGVSGQQQKDQGGQQLSTQKAVTGIPVSARTWLFFNHMAEVPHILYATRLQLRSICMRHPQMSKIGPWVNILFLVHPSYSWLIPGCHTFPLLMSPWCVL